MVPLLKHLLNPTISPSRVMRRVPACLRAPASARSAATTRTPCNSPDADNGPSVDIGPSPDMGPIRRNEPSPDIHARGFLATLSPQSQAGRLRDCSAAVSKLPPHGSRCVSQSYVTFWLQTCCASNCQPPALGVGPRALCLRHVQPKTAA
jgi:hypothetical protein